MKYLSYDEKGALGAVYDIPEWEARHNPFYRGLRLVPSPGEEAAYPTHYVLDGAVVLRPPLTPGHEGIPGGFRLWGLPIPCRVHVDELVYDVDDGELEWTTPISGIHQVRVSAWPYLGWERPVEVSS